MKWRDCFYFAADRVKAFFREASWPTRIAVLILVPVVIVAVCCGVASCVRFRG